MSNSVFLCCSLVNLEGATFVFSNEERNAQWCGDTETACGDCRGVTGDVSIMDQCSDRIMCPNLALKLVDLLQWLQDCIDRNSRLEIRQLMV